MKLWIKVEGSKVISIHFHYERVNAVGQLKYWIVCSEGSGIDDKISVQTKSS